jgi:two-component system CheB/CheR fusion protein
MELADYEAAAKAAAAELRRARQAEAEANRSREDFLAALSHELRTPLTPALALISSFEQDARLAEEVRTAMGVVRRNLELEALLIDDLVDLARIARGQLELHCDVTDMRQVIECTSEICCSKEILGERLTLSLDLAEKDHRVWGDGARLTQVFWHLLTNAVKFNRAGGSICVRSRLLAAEGTAATARGEGAQIEIEVADNGAGITPEVLPRIFDAFAAGETPVTRRRVGLGRGLTVSKAIVEKHGGTLTAASGGVDRGAAFVVCLPRWRQTAA